MTRKQFRLAGCAVLIVILATPLAHAAQVAGVTLPPTATVGGAQLRLKACAVREELWTNLYAVSVYLPPRTSVAQSIPAPSAKLIRIDVTYGGQVPDGLPSDWKEGLQHYVSQEFLRTLHGLYNDLKSGDTVLVSYEPRTGTSLSVNNRQVVSRPGADLFNAMMRLWIGPSPVSQNIKRLLLSGTC